MMQTLAWKEQETPAPHALASVFCVAGFLLYVLLSAPLMDSLGVHYASEGGHIYEKFHPGTLLVLLSFALLVGGSGQPVRQLMLIWRERTSFMALLGLYVMLFLYMALGSGTEGLGFIIDVQMSAVICAIVLSYAPAKYAQRAVALFLALAMLNSMIGLAEMAGTFRIFTFDPDWSVLSEDDFRATALLGHPLNNALFTAIALFVLLAARTRAYVKLPCAALLLASLAAFGGRAAIAYCAGGLLLLAGVRFTVWFFRREHTLPQLFAVAGMLVALPPCLIAAVYAVSHGLAGAHLAHSFYWDESAMSRALALRVFDYMSGEEILFGVSTERMMEIAYRISLDIPLFAIENPWLLMLMYLGAIAFPLWLVATLNFAYRLARNQPLALQLAVAAYFLIASSYNSFGCKSAIYPIMVSAVMCVARARKAEA